MTDTRRIQFVFNLETDYTDAELDSILEHGPSMIFDDVEMIAKYISTGSHWREVADSE